MREPEIDSDRIDDAVLALLYLTLQVDERISDWGRSWKTFDWGAMDRLFAKGLIDDPVHKSKSIMLSPEGVRRSRELFFKLFAKDDAPDGIVKLTPAGRETPDERG